MNSSFKYLPYHKTGYFSRLVTDYISAQQALLPLFEYSTDEKGMERAIQDRSKFPVDRELLVSTLKRQYKGLRNIPKVESNIESLGADTTYTICTAHQPNLLTGYLYFIYKILHAIKLAADLNTQYPGKHFVPVYYMGSEDNDLEELGTFRFAGEQYVWDGAGQKGAVGRMAPTGMQQLLDALYKVLGPPGEHCDRLKELLHIAYLQHNTIGSATQYLVHELFGEYGLVIIDPDDAALKQSFVPVMENELLTQSALATVTRQMEYMEQAGYATQAHPRPINLFYLHDQLRERITLDGEKWSVVNTNIIWSKPDLLKELHTHPERFSPNVILRGLFQETILPNVAFIGGGSEVAYWLQLMPVFRQHHIFYPLVLLRQSVLWISDANKRQMSKAGMDLDSLFLKENVLVQQYLDDHTEKRWELVNEMAQISQVLDAIKLRAGSIDTTLAPAAEAANKKIQKQLLAIEAKMKRAEKRQTAVHWSRLLRVKEQLFPRQSLQERTEAFLEYYLEYGSGFFDAVYAGIRPLQHEFLVVEA